MFILPAATTGMFVYATEAMKTLILINAGSAAALLALIVTLGVFGLCFFGIWTAYRAFMTI